MTPDMHREPSSAPGSPLHRVRISSRVSSFERENSLPAADEVGNRFETIVGRAIAAPVDVVFDAWTDGAIRRLWLGSGRFRIRHAVPHRLLVLVREDDSSVAVQFFPHGPDQSFVRLEHRGLAGSIQAARAKRSWEEKLTRLKVLLEGV